MTNGLCFLLALGVCDHFTVVVNMSEWLLPTVLNVLAFCYRPTGCLAFR